MTTIVTRTGKGSPLTHTEVDTNFTNLNTNKLEAGAIALGSAGTPSISFLSDTNTGIYSPGADQLAISTNGVARLTTSTTAVSSSLAVDHPLGAEATPSITFTGDLNTGFYSPAADTLAAVTAGSNRLHITSGGLVGIGTSAPTSTLHIQHVAQTAGYWEGKGLLIHEDATANQGIALYSRGSNEQYIASLADDATSYLIIGARKSSSTNGVDAMTIRGDGKVGIGSTSPGSRLEIGGDASNDARVTFNRVPVQASNDGVIGELFFQNNADSVALISVKRQSAIDDAYIQFATQQTSGGLSEKCRITSDGKLLVGMSTARSNFYNASSTQQFQIEGTTYENSGAAFICNSTSTGNGSLLMFGKSNLSTIGSNTLASQDSLLGGLTFQGNDASQFVEAASIMAFVDGTSGANDMPGRLVFSTTADGAASPTPRMTIKQDGAVLIGTTADLISDLTQVSVEGARCIDAKSTGGADNSVVTFWNNATTGNNLFASLRTETSDTIRGTIDYNRAAGQVRYNVTSDRRLKSDIEPAASALDVLFALQVRAYKWTETNYQVNYGFVAQELNEVAPDAVKAGDDGEKVTDAWSVDTGKLVPLLTKALQEAIGEIESLKARLTAAGID